MNLMRIGKCESRNCEEAAIGFNDDGEALCEDCMFEWVEEENLRLQDNAYIGPPDIDKEDFTS